MTGLVLGFGAFHDCADNPSCRIASALHGRQSGDLSIVGVEMPVSYGRSIQVTNQTIARVQPDWVLGIGVATTRTEPSFERYGTGDVSDIPDVDGECRAPGAPLHESITVDRFAAHLGCAVSEHAGSYVCNAWLNRIGCHHPLLPVNFLHVPRIGVDPDVLFAALVAVSAEVR